MKKLLILSAFLSVTLSMFAQEKYFTKSGTIQFDATAPSSPENIKAQNRSVSAVLDTKSGNMIFIVQMKGFEFEKALMQEHFNENYIESDRYPKAEFKGLVTNLSDINFSKDGTYAAQVKGALSIHGQSKPVEANGTLVIKDGKIQSSSKFTIVLKDYNINIPGLVADKIGKSATIVVDCTLQPFKG
jgi:polyisoprenoid-binding protein YceI